MQLHTSHAPWLHQWPQWLTYYILNLNADRMFNHVDCAPELFWNTTSFVLYTPKNHAIKTFQYDQLARILSVCSHKTNKIFNNSTPDAVNYTSCTRAKRINSLSWKVIIDLLLYLSRGVWLLREKITDRSWLYGYSHLYSKQNGLFYVFFFSTGLL